MIKRILLLGLLICSQILCAQKVYEDANLAFKKKEFVYAVKLYKEALKVARSRTIRLDIYKNLGDCYKNLNDLQNAMKNYNQCYKARSKDPELFLNMGEVLLKMGEYDDAIEFLNVYLESFPNDLRAKNLGESCLFAKKVNKASDEVVFKNEENLNTDYAEYGIATIDNKIIFSSSRKIRGNEETYGVTGQAFTDFYESEIDTSDNDWKIPELFEGAINTQYNEGACTFDENTNTMYFMLCNGMSGKKDNCSIFYSKYNKSTGIWSDPNEIKSLDKDYNYGHPAINKSGDRLYFVSDMPGGKGRKDIWFLTNNNGKWENPQNLGENINTQGDEQFPYLFGDSTLFFSSEGHPGYGGLDVFKSRQLPNGFTKPQNLGLPYNSSWDDFGIYLLGADSGFLCSNRPSGLGDDDIYSFYIKKSEYNLSGKIYDYKTKEPLPNALIILGDKELKFDTVRTTETGDYYVGNLISNKNYVITIYKDGYLGALRYYKPVLKNTKKQTDTLSVLNVGLIEITEEEIALGNIYYDFGKWNLTNSSKDELSKLVRLLKVNPSMSIRINSHTDTVGKSEFNEELSKYRAQSVVNYLIDYGIDQRRLSFKGWGESKPFIENPTNDEEMMLNRRTSFQIVNVDEVDNQYASAQYKDLTKSITLGYLREQETGFGSSNSDFDKTIVFRLQIYAGKEKISRSYIKQIEALIGRYDIVSSKGRDGMYRYAVGDFSKFDNAMDIKEKLLENGYESFVIAFMNNLRVTILEARQLSEKNDLN